MNRFVPSMKVFCVLVFFALTCPSANAQYTIDTTKLNSFNGVHPRLLMTASSFNTMKNNIVTPPAGSQWSDIWINFKTTADGASLGSAPAYSTAGATDPQIWQRTVSENAALLSMAYNLTRQSGPSSDTVWFEAEETPLTSPMSVVADPTASGGSYMATPLGGSPNSPNALPPSASYNFSTQLTGYYHGWALVYAPNNSANTWWTNVDGLEYSEAINTFGAWIWVNLGHWHLTPGNHVMNVTFQKQGLRIDKFMITTGGTIPTGLGTEQHWLEAENFSLNSNGVAPAPLNNLKVTTSNGLAPAGDAIALGKKWLETAYSAPNVGTLPVPTATPDAQQTVGLNGGSYDVWVRFKGSYVGHDNFYFAIDSAGYSTINVLDATVAFPYNTLVSPTLFPYNKTLAAANKPYPYREWVWKKIAANVALTAGYHILRVTNKTTNGNAGAILDRFLVTPTGTAAPQDPNKYLVAAQQWANALSSYPTWGYGGYSGNDLTAGENLVGLGLYYDWTYTSLGLLDRALVGNKLWAQGGTMNSAISTSWWKNAFVNNIQWTCSTGLTSAGLAIYGDGYGDTTPWLQSALTKMNNTLADMGGDGAHAEGIAYFGYGMEHLLEYMDMATQVMGAKNSSGATMFSTPGLAEAANYRLYFDLPADSQTRAASHINFADDYGIEWYGPDYQLRKLASLYNLPTAQWQATQYNLKKLNYSDGGASTLGAAPQLNLLWYNAGIAETSPTAAGLPTLGYFDDLDLIVSRSSWSGSESVLAYHCGPFLGHWVQATNTTNYIDWGSNHVHPDVSSFCLFGSGEWLVENEGYTFKWTAYSNSLLIGGVGQLGEGGDAFNGYAAKGEDPGGILNPAIDDTLSVSTPELDYIVGNATACYASTTGLTKYRRHLLFLKPDVLVVVDDVALTAAKALELRFFPKHSATFTQAGSTYTTAGTSAKMNFNVLQAPSQITTTVKTVPTQQYSDKSYLNRKAYSLATTSNLSSLSTAVSFAWSPVTGAPRTVTYLADPDGTAWKFKVGNQTIVLNRNAGQSVDEKARAVITLEAESGTLTAPMQAYTDATASGGQYLATLVGTTANIPDALTSPSAQYSATIPSAGNYAIWARIQAANASSNSIYYAVNPTGSSTYTLRSTSTYGSWVWVNLASSASLSAGTNVLGLKYAAANCKIDQVIITKDATYTPVGLY